MKAIYSGKEGREESGLGDDGDFGENTSFEANYMQQEYADETFGDYDIHFIILMVES